MVDDDFFQLLFMNREPDEVCYNSRDDDDVDTFFRVGLDLLLHLNLIDLLCNHYW